MKVINKKVLAQSQNIRITELEVHAPLIASKAQPGKFVVLMA